MRVALASLSGLFVASTAFSSAVEFPRHPAPSPDGTQIAFSWQGDVWVGPVGGGGARRLTANPGYDHHPVWLGREGQLAFVSDREGSDDVFVVDSDLGVPRRVTFHEAADAVQGQLGEDLVFLSRRHEAWDRMQAIYRIPLAGGTERVAFPLLALEAVPSPDGRRLALVRGGSPADRRHYRGAANRDVWLLDVTTGSLERVTRTDWDEDGVAWAGPDVLVYRSDGGGRDRNLYRLDVRSRSTFQLTRHEGSDVRSPRTSADGSLVAYELWDAVWVVPTSGEGVPRRVTFDAPADALESPIERETVRADASEVAVSPDGAQAALIIKGDVWVVQRRSKELASVAEAPTVRVTSTVARERDLTWSVDGTRLYYASDRHGQYDIHSVTAAGRPDGRLYRASGFVESRLTDTPEDERWPVPSPDGTSLAFTRGEGALVVSDADGANPRVILDHWGPVRFAWAPDSRWLALSREDRWHNHDVWIVPVAGGQAVNVSQHPQDDVGPVWSADGRRLYWLSRRHAGGVDVWFASLTRADHERTREEWLLLFEDEKPSKEGAKAGPGTAEEAMAADARAAKEGKGAEEKSAVRLPAKPIAVEADGIHERAAALTSLPGDEASIAVTPDSRTIVFVAMPEGERDLYAVRWDGKELKRLTENGANPSQVSFSRDGKTVFYRTGKGTVGAATLEGKAGDPTPFAARVAVDRAAMRAQVFDEAWRELDRNFYDPHFHGENWQALRDRYRSLGLAASSRRDFDDVMNLMLGELNASHMGFRPPGGSEARVQTGAVGVEVEPAPDGKGVRVIEVLPGTPAARVEGGIAVGERIVAVNGEEIGPRTNFSALLADTAGRRTRLRIASERGERDVVATPVAQSRARDARYLAWTRERRAMVEKLSGGKLGYVHIQGMNEPSLEEFQRELFAAADGRQGLLIDVRNNGGGWTTDYLLAILSVKRHAWTVPRGADPGVKAYPQDRLPLPAWTRPAVTLCDEASYSNAEIFSWAFKTLERGPVVGMPTFGAVISTGGAGLTDGSFVRLPGRGWYVAGSGVNMELNGCPPDHVVEQPPIEDMARDRDTQLARAVEVLLAELPADPATLPW
ncbi:MAG: S41 family peptidase [Acidobacteriota bacterium]